jgi:hypothetical protein
MPTDYPSRMYIPELSNELLTPDQAKAASPDITKMFEILEMLRDNEHTDHSETCEQFFLKYGMKPELVPLMDSILTNDRGTDMH